MSEHVYTCTREFEIASETDAGEAIYQHLDSHHPLKPYEKLPAYVTLYTWATTDNEIDEDVYELVEVKREQIHVATWCKKHWPEAMKHCVAPGEERDDD